MQAMKLNDLCLNHKLPEDQRLSIEANIKRLCRDATVLPIQSTVKPDLDGQIDGKAA